MQAVTFLRLTILALVVLGVIVIVADDVIVM